MQLEWLLVSKPVRAPFRDGSTVLARDLVAGLDPEIRLRYFGDPSQPLRENGVVLEASAMGYAPGAVEKARTLAAILGNPGVPLHLFFTPGQLTGAVVGALRRIPPRRPVIHTLTSAAGATDVVRWLRDLDAVVVHSEHTREALLQAGLAPDRVRRIYPGVAPAEPIPDPAASQRLLYAGDLDATVVARLLALARGLDERHELVGWTLSIASRPKDPSHGELLAELRGCLPARARVELLGEVDDMDALMRSSALQVFCATHARRKVDLPLVLLEGCTRGLPLIVLDAGPPRELIDEALARGLEPGLAVRPAELVGAVAAAVSDPERLRRWGRDAQALALQAFSLQRMLDAYAALYRELRS